MARRNDGLTHVTDVFGAVGLVDNTWSDEWHMDLGTAVHSATALDDKGELDEASVDGPVEPYLRAWRTFRDVVKPRIIEIEKPRKNKTYDFVGTPDRLIVLPKTRTKTVLDIKTGGILRWHRLQTAGYSLLYRFSVDRMAVYLKRDGSFDVRTHNNRGDVQAFLSTLALANFLKGA